MDRTVTGNFEVHCALTQQRTVKITGVIYNDDVAGDISKRVDMAQDELDRQFIRGDILNKTAQIAQRHENIKRMQESVEGLTRKKEGARLKTQEQLQLDNFDVSLKGELSAIESLEAAIVAGRKKIETA